MTMHHEVVGVLPDVELLKQERAIPAVQIRQSLAGPRKLKAEVLVKLLGKFKVPRQAQRP